MFFDPLYLKFVIACVTIVLLPGPTMTLIVANSMKYHPLAGIKNIIGTQSGIALMLILLAIGLDAVTTHFASFFTFIQYAGATYLIGLGLFLFFKKEAEIRAVVSNKNFILQGVIVTFSNPKVFLFLGAFIPQFVDPAGNIPLQILFFGGTFMAIATILDSLYAFLAGWISNRLEKTTPKTGQRVVGIVYCSVALWLLSQ